MGKGLLFLTIKVIIMLLGRSLCDALMPSEGVTGLITWGTVGMCLFILVICLTEEQMKAFTGKARKKRIWLQKCSSSTKNVEDRE